MLNSKKTSLLIVIFCLILITSCKSSQEIKTQENPLDTSETVQKQQDDQYDKSAKLMFVATKNLFDDMNLLSPDEQKNLVDIALSRIRDENLDNQIYIMEKLQDAGNIAVPSITAAIKNSDILTSTIAILVMLGQDTKSTAEYLKTLHLLKNSFNSAVTGKNAAKLRRDPALIPAAYRIMIQSLMQVHFNDADLLEVLKTLEAGIDFMKFFSLISNADVEILNTFLAHKSSVVRIQTAKVLYEMDNALAHKALTTIMAEIDSTDKLVRMNVYSALAGMGKKARPAVPRLLKLLSEQNYLEDDKNTVLADWEDESISETNLERLEITKALALIGIPGQDSIIDIYKLLGSKKADYRLYAVLSLYYNGNDPDNKTIERLLHCLSDRDRIVQITTANLFFRLKANDKTYKTIAAKIVNWIYSDVTILQEIAMKLLMQYDVDHQEILDGVIDSCSSTNYVVSFYAGFYLSYIMKQNKQLRNLIANQIGRLGAMGELFFFLTLLLQNADEPDLEISQILSQIEKHYRMNYLGDYDNSKDINSTLMAGTYEGEIKYYKKETLPIKVTITTINGRVYGNYEIIKNEKRYLGVLFKFIRFSDVGGVFDYFDTFGHYGKFKVSLKNGEKFTATLSNEFSASDVVEATSVKDKEKQ